MQAVKQIFYGSVRANAGLSAYPQVLCLYGDNSELLWEGFSGEITFSDYTSGRWESSFDRGRLDGNDEVCSDTETETVTATVSLGGETGEITFSYQGEFYRFPIRIQATNLPEEDLSDEDFGIEFSTETVLGSKEAFTEPPSTLYGDLYIARRTNGTGGDLHVSGNIHAANYPPPKSESDTGREVTSIIGDGERRVFFLTHTLGVREVNITVYADADNSKVLVRCVIQSVGNICVTFVDPPAEDETFTVIIQK